MGVSEGKSDKWWDRLLGRTRKSKDAEEVPSVPYKKLLKLNIPDWPLVVVGIISSGLIGAFLPTIAIIFSEVLRVSDTVIN